MRTAESGFAPDPRSPDTWQGALAMHARVVGAVIMRDLQTRFGTSYAGYLLSIFVPLSHLVIALLVYSVIARGAPLGVDLVAFLTIAILPFVIWLYTHKQMYLALQTNRALLFFPGVTIVDLLMGRAIVELCTTTLVILVVVLTVTLAGHPLSPADPTAFCLALGRAYLLGIATGMFFGALAFVWAGALLPAGLMGPLYWVSCGLFFLPSALPEQVRKFLVLFPLTHVIDYARLAYYSEYTSDFSAVITPDMLIFSILAVAVFTQHAVRKYG